YKGTQIFLSKLHVPSLRSSQEEVIKQIQEGIQAIPGTLPFTKGLQLINVDLSWSEGGHYQYRLRGLEIKEVEAAAEALKKKMQSTPEFPFVNLSVKHDDPKLVVKVEEKQAEKFGFSKQEIQSLLQQAYSGVPISYIHKGADQYKVTMELE